MVFLWLHSHFSHPQSLSAFFGTSRRRRYRLPFFVRRTHIYTRMDSGWYDVQNSILSPLSPLIAWKNRNPSIISVQRNECTTVKKNIYVLYKKLPYFTRYRNNPNFRTEHEYNTRQMSNINIPFMRKIPTHNLHTGRSTQKSITHYYKTLNVVRF